LSSQRFILGPSKRQCITTPNDPDRNLITSFHWSAPKSFYKALLLWTPLGEALKNRKMSTAFLNGLKPQEYGRAREQSCITTNPIPPRKG
jgi:hypothetical protein